MLLKMNYSQPAIAVLIFFVINGCSNTGNLASNENKGFTPPELIGGLSGIQEKLNYPKFSEENYIEGRVVVHFFVTEKGDVEDPTILESRGSNIDAEVIRVVRQAKFRPATNNGVPVRVQFKLPVNFRLHNSK